MSSWQIVRVFAGTVIVLSLLLGTPASPVFLSQYWLLVTAFVGLNLFQSGFSRWCPLEFILRKCGVHAGA